jgi:hypothetical protein
MKNYILLFAVFFSSFSLINAQEDDKVKNTKEETITKTVTVKGVTEETTETVLVKKEKQVIEINDTGVENQNEVHKSETQLEEKQVVTKALENKENTAALAELKKKQEAEIEASKQEQYAKYEAERKEKEKKTKAKKDDDD